MTSSDDASWRHLLAPDELRVMQRYARSRAPVSVRRPALLVVDAVETFVGPDLPVHQAQDAAVTACGHHAWVAVREIRALLEHWRERGLPVAFSTVARLPRGDGPDGGNSRDGALRGDRVVPEIAPVAGEGVFPKTRPSMFFGTPLLTWLRTVGADAVVLTGGSTSGCVRASAVDAYSYGFETVVAQDACFDRIRSAHDRALLDLSFKYARVMPTADAVALAGALADWGLD